MPPFDRDKSGKRLLMGGMDLVHSVDQLPPNKSPFCQNVRAYKKSGIVGRNLLTDAILSLSSTVHTLSPSLTCTSPSDPPYIIWTNPANATSLSLYATVTLNTVLPTSGELYVTVGPQSIPSSAVITSLVATCDSYATGSANLQSLLSISGYGGQVSLTTTPAPYSFSAWNETLTPALLNTGFNIAFRVINNDISTISAYLNTVVITINYTTSGTVPHTIRRLNDSTPNGPSSGYSLMIGNGTVLTAWNPALGVDNVASGLSGNPLSMVPFRPNTSVQPWMYVGDSAPQGDVTLHTEYLILNGDGAHDPVDFVSNAMMKVRSDGVIYKMGVKEPQLAPVVSTENTGAPFGVGASGNLLATAIPWTNYTGANSGYSYGETNGYPHPPSGRDGSAPFVVNVLNASTVTVTSLTGTATVNGASHAPTDTSSTWVGGTYPGQFVRIEGIGGTPTTASVVLGAFTDGAGNVVPLGVAPIYVSSVVDVGAMIGTPIRVPFGAVDFQIGINSAGNSYSSNSGAFTIVGTVITNALPTVTSTLGTLTAYYWGDSPTSNSTSAYIWKNPDDPGGSGPARSSSDAVGNTTGNSFIFDATFTTGIPGLPGIGSPSLPMEWTTLTPDSVASGSNAVFTPAIKGVDGNTAYQNFNFCLTGSIYYPSAGQYTHVLTNHDDCIWGIGGGVTLVSATISGSGEGSSATISGSGQTITVVGGYPLLPRQSYTHGDGGKYAQTTVIVNVPAAGIYPIEIDYDYWYHSGRILLLMVSPTAGAPATIVPPLSANVRQQVQYRYVYRSSATGALSNPSPESTAQSVPVTANTVTSLWSDDPQVDVVDYYRIDSVTSNFTYVNTGPNDNSGTGALAGTNTPVTDSLTDTELGTKLLDYDNFEPFPSIDLPQSGVCNVSGGVITWVSGGAIGGSATGFNSRWLAGTNILIGSPTSLAYTLIARPVSNTITIPGVPDGTNLAYEIEEPILAAQPLPYMWGPTDNVNFVFAVGDPLRPGTLYWCQGSNLDSAPDTNQMEVTDPAEPLVAGAISGGLGVLFSIKRAWVIMPNFFNALATVTGTVGATWSLQETSITRGLYMPRCVCVSGGGNIFFRVTDGIHASAGGAASESISDQDLYPLFPHENEDGGTSIPQPVTIAGYTIYPPDDSKPQSQRMYSIGAYVYFDFVGTDGVAHTLVFDEAAKGWVYDLYTPSVTVHATNEGQSVQGVLAGCNDGTIRQMASGGTEVATAVFLTPAENFGDARANKNVGDLYVETSNP